MTSWDPIITTGSSLDHKWWDISKRGPSINTEKDQDANCLSWGPDRLEVLLPDPDSSMLHKCVLSRSVSGWAAQAAVGINAPVCLQARSGTDLEAPNPGVGGLCLPRARPRLGARAHVVERAALALARALPGISERSTHIRQRADEMLREQLAMHRVVFSNPP